MQKSSLLFLVSFFIITTICGNPTSLKFQAGYKVAEHLQANSAQEKLFFG